MLTKHCLIGNSCKPSGGLITAIKSTTCGCLSRICERSSNVILRILNTLRRSLGLDIVSTVRSNLYKIFMLFPLLLYVISPTLELPGSIWKVLDSSRAKTKSWYLTQLCLQTRRGRMNLTGSWKLLLFSLEATIAAINRASTLLRGLNGHISLVVANTVPYPLPLENPPVSLDFNKHCLLEIAQASPVETTVHLYLCRCRSEILTSVLKPGSLVVIGSRKRWWPTWEKRLA